MLPFPLQALPPDLAAFVSDVAATTNTPPDYAGCFALAVAAGAVGATHAAAVKAGHAQRASLYVCAVAPKGSGKTPALSAVAQPVYEAQAELYRGPDKKRKAFVSDVTAEKLAEVLAQNPRGALMIRDELAGWLLSFNQYKAGGKGSDRQFYLSAWSGEPVSVDRKGKDTEPLYVRHPCLTVVGTIQPSVLDRFKADADDGFYDRVLFCYPDELPLVGERWQTIDPNNARAWAAMVGRLRDLQMTTGSMLDPHAGAERPFFLDFNDDARRLWQAWTEYVADMVNDADFDPTLRGPAVKLSGYAARLALVAHMLRRAAGEPVRNEIEGEDMSRGTDLGLYFLSHARRAWAATGLDGKFVQTRRLLAWIAAREGQPFTRRDAHRGLVRAFPTAEALTEPLRTLVQNCYLRYAAAGCAESPAAAGRPTVVYEINPELCQRVSADELCQRVSAPAK